MVHSLTLFTHGCAPFGNYNRAHREELSKGFPWKARFVEMQSAKIRARLQPYVFEQREDREVGHLHNLEALDACHDEYRGIVIDPFGLPSSANAFSSVLRASLSDWKFKGKKGVCLKILEAQAELVPINIQAIGSSR